MSPSALGASVPPEHGARGARRGLSGLKLCPQPRAQAPLPGIPASGLEREGERRQGIWVLSKVFFFFLFCFLFVAHFRGFLSFSVNSLFMIM